MSFSLNGVILSTKACHLVSVAYVTLSAALISLSFIYPALQNACKNLGQTNDISYALTYKIYLPRIFILGELLFFYLYNMYLSLFKLNVYI